MTLTPTMDRLRLASTSRMQHLVYVIVLGLLQVVGGQDIPLKKGDLVGPRLGKAGEQVVRWDKMSKQTT